MIFIKTTFFAGKDFFKEQFVLELPTIYSEPVISREFIVKGASWCSEIKRIYKNETFLHIFLRSGYLEDETSVSFSLKLISAVDEQLSILKGGICDFRRGENFGAGWSQFILWSKLEDPHYGFVRDGKITLEVDVTAV